MSKDKCGKNKKAESALEFILLFSFVFLIFMGMFVVFNKRLVAISKESEELELNKINEKIVAEIEVAKTVHNGYHRSFLIPLTFLGYPYTVQLEKDPGILLISINTGSREKIKVVKLDPSTILGSIKPGENTLIKSNDLICFNMKAADCVIE